MYKHFSQPPTRKQSRLEGYDYSTDGAYFITICTKDKQCLLGHCVGGGVLDAPQIQLSSQGKVVDKYIHEINRIYKHIRIEKYVIMPNHLHMILVVTVPDGMSRTPSPTNAIVPQTISTLKRFIHRECNQPIFQRGFYDHIIRCEEDHRMIWEYIDTNPVRWQEDKFYID